LWSCVVDVGWTSSHTIAHTADTATQAEGGLGTLHTEYKDVDARVGSRVAELARSGDSNSRAGSGQMLSPCIFACIPFPADTYSSS